MSTQLWSHSVTQTLPNTSPHNSTLVTVRTHGDPTHPGPVYREQTEGGFSSNCCNLQKAMCWTHSGSQWQPYILHSALSLCHGGLWMSSLLGCGSGSMGGDRGRGRKQVLCVSDCVPVCVCYQCWHTYVQLKLVIFENLEQLDSENGGSMSIYLTRVAPVLKRKGWPRQI